MGFLFSKVQDLWSNVKKESRVLMLGVDGAGKTAILYRLHLNETVTTTPTIGFNVESITVKNMEIVLWDVGGNMKLRRSIWEHYYPKTDALIFVVDASDTHKIDEAAEELHNILSNVLMRNCIVLIFANKTDLPNALKAKELHDLLQLNKLLSTHKSSIHIQESSAVTGQGLYEGMNWMVDALNVK